MKTFNVYQYVVILKPSETQENHGIKPEIQGSISAVLAESERSALLKIVSGLSNDLKENIDNIDIVLRPF